MLGSARRQCVVLAVGLGTRKLPPTEACPKAMLAVNGKPFVEYQLAWLSAEGFTHAVYSIGHLGAMIRDHVGDGQRWGCLLYTSDAADDLLCVDLGGRRII